MMHQEEVDDKIQVTDEEMQKFYDENIDLMALPPKAHIRYIRIGLGQTEDEQKAARTRADEAYKKLVPGLFQQGADFAGVAQEYSEDPETAAQGGELSDWRRFSCIPSTKWLLRYSRMRSANPSSLVTVCTLFKLLNAAVPNSCHLSKPSHILRKYLPNRNMMNK
jgi:hypothetical protein